MVTVVILRRKDKKAVGKRVKGQQGEVKKRYVW